MRQVKIEGQVYQIEFNGLTFRKYRHIFGKDVLASLFNAEKALDEEIIENITWLVCFQNNPDIPPINEWLESLKSPYSLIKAWKDVYAEFVQSMVTTIEAEGEGKSDKSIKKKEK